MNAIDLYRIGNWFVAHRLPYVPKLVWGINYLVFGASIPCSARIGSGTRLGYGGMGIVIHARAVIGDGCLISQQVTIGGRSKAVDVPVIGNRVYIGAGARILGPVRVGDGAVIGANAVVVKDVPSRCVVAGVPAKVIKHDVDSSDYI